MIDLTDDRFSDWRSYDEDHDQDDFSLYGVAALGGLDALHELGLLDLDDDGDLGLGLDDADGPERDLDASDGGGPDEPSDRDDLAPGDGAPSGRGTRRRRQLIGSGMAMLLGVGAFFGTRVDGVGSPAPMSEQAFCEELERIDVGESLGGDLSEARVVAVASLADIGDRAPAGVLEAMTVMGAYAAERPEIRDLADADLDDPDVKGAAFRAVYRLHYQPDFRVAATKIERFAVETCGLTPSGRFDLSIDPSFDSALFPGLDLSEYEDPVFAADETDFERFELEEIDDPYFEVDRSDFDQYQLELPDEANP